MMLRVKNVPMPRKFPSRVVEMPEHYREERVRRQRRECWQSHGSAFRRVVHRPQLLNTQRTDRADSTAANYCRFLLCAFSIGVPRSLSGKCCISKVQIHCSSDGGKSRGKKSFLKRKITRENVFHSTSGNHWIGKEKHANLGSSLEEAAINAESCEMTREMCLEHSTVRAVTRTLLRHHLSCRRRLRRLLII